MPVLAALRDKKRKSKGSLPGKETKKEKEIFKVNKSKTTFSLKGAEYFVKDFAYLRPHYFAADSKAMDTSKSRKNTRLKSFVVCHLLEIKLSKSYKLADPESTKVKVRRFFRPDDISPEKAHLSDVREVRTYFCLCKELLFQES